MSAPNVNPSAPAADELNLLLDDILTLCSPANKNRDLDLWRQLFALWHDANIFNDQPSELGGEGSGSPCCEDIPEHPPSASLFGYPMIKADKAQTRLDDFEAELVARRWIKRVAPPRTNSPPLTARHRSLGSGLDAAAASGPGEAEGVPSSLADVEKSDAGRPRRRTSSHAGYDGGGGGGGRVARALSMPSPFPMNPLRRSSTAMTAASSLSSSPRDPRRGSGCGSFLGLRRLSSANGEEDGVRVAKVRNARSRAAVEAFLDLHQTQIERLREAEAEVKTLESTEAIPSAGGAHPGGGGSGLRAQLDSFAFKTAAADPHPASGDDSEHRGQTQNAPSTKNDEPIRPTSSTAAAAAESDPPVRSGWSPLTRLVNARLRADLPLLDDHRCAICLSLAFRPVLLPGCAHLFCLRCLVKLQRRFFSSLRSSRLGANAGAGGVGGGGGGDDVPARLHAGPMRSMSSVAWALYEQEAEYRASVRAQQRLREELASQRERQLQIREEDEGQDPNGGDDSPAAQAPTGAGAGVAAAGIPLLASLPAKIRAAADCPLCRHPQAVALADGSNVSAERERFLKTWFPREVAVKKKADLKEVEREEAMRLGLDQTKCVIM